MKGKFFLFSFFIFINGINAQTKLPQVHIPMYFEDALGNRDTVYVGFDSDAENDILNGDFGERIINDVPWKKDFEVRLGTFSGPFGKLPRLSKIDIQENNCPDSITGYTRTFNVLYLKAKHFPIKWTWDSTQFKNGCTFNSFYDRSAKSQLATVNWLAYAQYFRDFKGITYLTESYVKNTRKNGFYYDFVDPISAVDSIKSVSFYLLDKKRVAFDILGTSNFYTNSVKYFPNPTSDRLTVQLEQNLDRASLEIIGMNGQILQRQLIENGVTQLETDVSALPTGLYFLQVREQERLIFTGKFVKIE